MNPSTQPLWFQTSNNIKHELQAIEAIFCGAMVGLQQRTNEPDHHSLRNLYYNHKAALLGVGISYSYNTSFSPTRDHLCMEYQNQISQLGPDHWKEALLNHLSTATSTVPSASIFIPSLVW